MKTLLAALSLALLGNTAGASAVIGQPAPAFSAQDANGRSVSLADFKGKHVVLEWVNPGCPYVRKHYDAKNMQATQQSAQAKGVVWLAVNSTHSGHGDYLPPARMAGWMQAQGAQATATLMDANGQIGRAYGARTTPHMYLIDPAGRLVYAGAIDSKASANPADIPGATNHVNQAIGESLAGRPLSTPATRAYGCTVKYGSAG